MYRLRFIATGFSNRNPFAGLPLNGPFSPAPKTTTGVNLAAGAKVSLRPAPPFPRLLLLLPDRVQTPPNTSAISL